MRRPPPCPSLFPYTTLFRSGRVGIGADGRDSGFQISQRADFFEVEVGLETTLKRPIINTRDEPHADPDKYRSEEHTSELQSRGHLVCRLLLEKKKSYKRTPQ